MSNFGQVPSESLLACFFSECENHFRFMEQQYRFQYFSGVVQHLHGRQVITPYEDRAEINHPFIATTRYEKEGQAFEILYSEDLFLLECYIIKDQIYRVRLEELLKATKKAETLDIQHQIAAQPNSLSDAIRTLAKTVRENKGRLIDPSPKLFERALTIREKLLEHTIREQNKKALEQTSAEAARAFMHKDFPKVIGLLHPFESHLSPVDRKKLEQARKKLKSA